MDVLVIRYGQKSVLYHGRSVVSYLSHSSTWIRTGTLLFHKIEEEAKDFLSMYKLHHGTLMIRPSHDISEK